MKTKSTASAQKKALRKTDVSGCAYDAVDFAEWILKQGIETWGGQYYYLPKVKKYSPSELYRLYAEQKHIR